jgi:hypothetical protein
LLQAEPGAVEADEGARLQAWAGKGARRRKGLLHHRAAGGQRQKRQNQE